MLGTFYKHASNMLFNKNIVLKHVNNKCHGHFQDQHMNLQGTSKNCHKPALKK